MQSTLLPIVGGWRSLMATGSLVERDAVMAMHDLAKEWQGKTVSVVLKLEDVTWTSDPVVNCYVADQLVGSVAAECADRACELIDEPIDALLTMRGRTVYAVLVA